MRWIFAFFLISVGIYLMRGTSLRNLAIRRLLFFGFVMAGFVSLIFANEWTKISSLLGVESGTALLTYLVTFSFIGFVISNFRWRQQHEERIVELARRVALGQEYDS